MALPDLNDVGDLPAGVHSASLEEVRNHFGQSTNERIRVYRRLERIYRLMSTTGHLKRFVVFGSFVTSKPAPNNADIFAIMDDDFDVSELTGEAALLFDHSIAQNHFAASVFWLRSLAALGGEEKALAQWQIKRDGTERGIIEVISE